MTTENVPLENIKLNICACNKCGLEVKPGKRFIKNHHRIGVKHTDEYKLKRSKLFKGRKKSDEHKKNISISLTGRKLSEKHRENVKIGVNKPENIERNKLVNSTPEKIEKARAQIIKQYEMGTFGWHSLDTEKVEKRRKKLIVAMNSSDRREKSRLQAIKMLNDPSNNFGYKGFKESYPEKCYREYLEKNLHQIKGIHFFQEHHVGPYRLDFAWAESKRGIEIDGSQHLTPKAIEHDKIRDEWLRGQGWVIIRILVRDLKSLLSISYIK